MNLTKREYIATMIIAGMLANDRVLRECEESSEDNGVDPLDTILPLVLRFTDALIGRLNPVPIVTPEPPKGGRVVKMKKDK